MTILRGRLLYLVRYHFSTRLLCHLQYSMCGCMCLCECVPGVPVVYYCYYYNYCLLLLLLIKFIQCIYNYIPETNHVSSVYNSAAVLWLWFMVHLMLFPMINISYFYICAF
jgi:hypothetical protein